MRSLCLIYSIQRTSTWILAAAGWSRLESGIRAISAIVVALWDILKQVCGQPVDQLLGAASTDPLE